MDENKVSFELAEEQIINLAVSYSVIPKPPASYHHVKDIQSCTCVPVIDLPMETQYYDAPSCCMLPEVLNCPLYENDPSQKPLSSPGSDISVTPPMCQGVSAEFISPNVYDSRRKPYDIMPTIDLHKEINKCEHETWCFEFPKAFCGRLIGKKGRNIKSLLEASGAFISFEDIRDDNAVTLMKISGKKQQILDAIQIIKTKFVDVKLSKLGETKVLALDGYENENVKVLQLMLPSNTRTDVLVSYTVNAGHVYLQMTDVTTQSLLETLQEELSSCYNKQGIPELFLPPVLGTYCVVKCKEKWFRCQVIQRFDESEQVEVVLVDYGILVISKFSSLKKIRSDFLKIPFQAIECCLLNVVPKEGELLFSLDALKLLQKLTIGKTLQAISRNNFDIPFVEIFVKGENKISLNRILVQEGVVASPVFDC